MNSSFDDLVAPTIPTDDDAAVIYTVPRPLTSLERKHPLAESGWHAIGHTTLEGQVDTLLIKKGGHHRLLELFEDGYEWARERQCLAWQEFIDLETERGDRKGWLDPCPMTRLTRPSEAALQPRIPPRTPSSARPSPRTSLWRWCASRPTARWCA